MALTPMFNPHTLVQQRARQFGARFERALLLVLNEIGMELVKIARDEHNYTDRTGKLTNSMGYAVIKGHHLLQVGGEGSGEGSKAAMETCLKVAGETPYKYTLAIVAGMDYAAYVEAKGYNVLIPAELQASKIFVPRMKELFAKFDAKLKEMMK